MRTHNHPTAMYIAFASAKVERITPLVSICLGSLERYAKTAKGKASKGWNANLSYRTYRALAGKGVPLQ